MNDGRHEINMVYLLECTRMKFGLVMMCSNIRSYVLRNQETLSRLEVPTTPRHCSSFFLEGGGGVWSVKVHHGIEPHFVNRTDTTKNNTSSLVLPT